MRNLGMNLKIGDIVDVTIIKCQLCGLHNVKIINAPQYDALLLTSSNLLNSRSQIFYTGLSIKARVIRINQYYVDLIPLFSQKLVV